MRTLQNDINASSEKFGFVEYFEGSLRDGESKKVADSIIPENLQNLDPRRQKIIPVDSYFATYAELPPSPSVEPKLMEDLAMDLQQIASEQISRIDEENNVLLQKHEESSENIENESAEPSNDVENYDSVEAPSEDTEATSVDNEDNTEDSVQESTEEKSEENTVDDDADYEDDSEFEDEEFESEDDESEEDKKEGED